MPSPRGGGSPGRSRKAPATPVSAGLANASDAGAAAAAPLQGLAPILDQRAQTLILGSFPSEASLTLQQYYGHRQNHFWKILGEIVGQPLYDMDYAARKPLVQAAGIAIWDVYANCLREGSLDSAIRDSVINDFSILKSQAPYLRRVCFNGKTAGKLLKMFGELGYEVHQLPSTSPAYTLPFAEKLARWREVLG